MTERRHGVWAAVLAACLTTAPLAAQTTPTPPPANDPAWLVKRYFVDHAFPGEGAYLVGEMAAQDVGRSVGSLLPPGFRASYRRLMNDGTRAVYAVLVVGQGQFTDSYAYLEKDSTGWKIAAVRALKLPREFLNALRVLRQQHNLPDSVHATFLNMQLLAAPDTSLKLIFLEHKQAFETLVSEYRAQGEDGVSVSPSGRPTSSRTFGPVERRLASLHLTSVYRERTLPGCVFVVIGNEGTSAVGYLYDAGGCHVPEMSPDHFIYVERIAPRWWVYKTS